MGALRDAVRWLVVVVVLVAIPVAWHEGVLDDAYIAFRYARNLASGLGLVFNPGERVEGFTSPLWTLWMAAGIALGADPATLAQALSVLCNLVLVWLVYRFARVVLGLATWWAWSAVILLVADINLEAWSALGLETNLFALLVFAGIAAIARAPATRAGRAWTAGGIVLGLASWTRPEGIVFLPVLAGVHLLAALVRMDGRSGHRGGDDAPWPASGATLRLIRAAGGALRPAWPAICTWLGLLAVLFLARYAYYGEWLPNTYYAKASGGAGSPRSGLNYFVAFATSSWLYGVAVVPAAISMGRRPARVRAMLASVVAVNVAYVVWLGGDTFKGARFFLPALAPFTLLVVDGLAALAGRARIPHRVKSAMAILVVGAMVGGVAWGTWGPLARQAALAASMTRNRAYVGRLLRAITPPDTLLAMTTVGALPYYAERPVIDLYGLTDAHIARVHVPPGVGGTGHEKGDGAYVLSRAPDLILLRNVWIADVPIEDHHALYGLSEHQIAADSRFRTTYVPVNLRLRPDLLFGFYANKDTVDIDALEARFAEQDLSALGPLERLTNERGMDLLWLHQGIELLSERRLQEARVALERSLKLYPKSVDAHLAMARVLENMGDVPGAIVHLEQGHRLEPSRPDILVGLGGLYARAGRLEEAASRLKQAADLAPEDKAVWRDLATVRLQQHRYVEAVPALHAVVALDPKAVDVWVKLGVAAGMAGDWLDARCALDQALALAPEAPAVIALRKWFAEHRPASLPDAPCPRK